MCCNVKTDRQADVHMDPRSLSDEEIYITGIQADPTDPEAR